MSLMGCQMHPNLKKTVVNLTKTVLFLQYDINQENIISIYELP